LEERLEAVAKARTIYQKAKKLDFFLEQANKMSVIMLGV
jgi:hypothetical protein